VLITALAGLIALCLSQRRRSRPPSAGAAPL